LSLQYVPAGSGYTMQITSIYNNTSASKVHFNAGANGGSTSNYSMTVARIG
jgi:hypothetical protein